MTHWWAEHAGPTALWSDVVTVSSRLAWRRRRWEDALSLRDSHTVTQLVPGRMTEAGGVERWADDWTPLSINVVETICETLHSRLTSSQVRPMFVTSGGSYRQRRQTERAGAFMDGVFYGARVHTDIAPDVCDDAIGFGTGIAYAWIEGGRVHVERVRPWELLVDEIDGHDRKPRCVYRVRYVDREVAATRWPDAAALIAQAPAPTGDWAVYDQTLSDVILVVEAWRLPSGPDAGDGVRMIGLQNGEIAREEWKHDRFPFAVMRYRRGKSGWYGVGVPEMIEGLQVDINETLLNIRECHRQSTFRVFVERGSKINKQHINNVAGSILEYEGTLPTFANFQTVNAEMYNWIDTQTRRAFERCGVSQLAAQAQLPAGLHGASGKALRAYINESDSRFVLQLREYEDWHVDLAEIIMLALEDTDESVTATSVKNGSVSEIDWRRVKLSKPFVLQVLPASLLPTTVAGRLESVQELVSSGMADALGLDAASIQRLLDMPDLAAEGLTAARDAVDLVIETMLDDRVAAVPDSTLDLAICLRQGVRWYQQLRRDGEDVNSEELALLREFIDQTVALQGEASGPSVPQPEAPPAPEVMQ